MSDVEDRPAVVKASLVGLRARKYHLECEMALTRSRIKMAEAKLKSARGSHLIALREEESAARHDSRAAEEAVARAARDYERVLAGEGEIAANEAKAGEARAAKEDDA